MIMSDEEKDKLIKEKLATDKYVFSGIDEYDKKIMNEIEESNIKPSRFTHREKKIITIAFFLVFFFILTTYYYYNKYENAIVNPNTPTSILDKEITNELPKDENIEKDKEKVKNETVNESTEEAKNEIETSKVEIPEINKPNEELANGNNDETNLPNERGEIFKKEVELYSLGINRFDGELNSKEENTILVMMAMNAKADNKSEITVEEVNNFVKAITGENVNFEGDVNPNYIKYIDQTKKYTLIQKGNPYIYEKCNILICDIISETEDKIEVSGVLEKTVQSDKYTYRYTAYFVKNKEENEYFTHHIEDFSYKFQKKEKNDNIQIEKV